MQRIDEIPTHELNGIRYRRGHVLPFGASVLAGGAVNFSISSRDATAASLVLFHHGEREPYAVIPFPEEFRVGSNYAMMVFGLDPDDLEYGYKLDGPHSPEEGLLFDRDRILLDPYAKLISGREVWGKKDENYSGFEHRGKVLLQDYDWEGDRQLEIPMKDLIVYEMHVRGFTADPSSHTRHGGTYAALVEKIPYLKETGINCVELLPIFEFDETENKKIVNGKHLLNYWGYSTVGFYAPKAGYAMSGPFGLAADEVKNLVKKLHANGIEIILDVVFNHTAEGDERGPVISYKGIDNRGCYILKPDGSYYNFSGCGNTFRCNSPVIRNHILDCLRYWVSEYHIDGFRFDLASILSRDSNGNSMTDPPLLEELAHDSILGKTKLIAEAWDAGGLYQVGTFPNWGRWAEWNGKFRDCVRRFIKSDASAGPELLLRMKGSPDLYGNRSAEASINFITCHDGFTLRDLVSYNEKHNGLNGEDNRDGANDNNSWNCGVEGDTEDPVILALRSRQIKNAMTLLMLSRGVPMMLAGDEFGNTQSGNNNAYCQDNGISWLNWDEQRKHEDILQYCRKMIRLRHEHPVLRNKTYTEGYNSSGYPEISFHGTQPWNIDIRAPFLTFGIMYAEPAADYHTAGDAFIYCAVNAWWEDAELELPIIPEGMSWHVYAYTGDDSLSGFVPEDRRVKLMARSSMILIGRAENMPG